jgi:hypothetical protein
MGEAVRIHASEARVLDANLFSQQMKLMVRSV